MKYIIQFEKFRDWFDVEKFRDWFDGQTLEFSGKDYVSMTFFEKIKYNIETWRLSKGLYNMSLYELNLIEARMRRDGVWTPDLNKLFAVVRAQKET